MLSHDCKIRVWYKHTDQMAICHHSNYICYYEAARSELLRDLGMSFAEVERRGIMMPILEVQSKYRKPAYFDELLTVRIILREKPAARINFFYEIYNEKGELINTGMTSWASSTATRAVRAAVRSGSSNCSTAAGRRSSPHGVTTDTKKPGIVPVVRSPVFHDSSAGAATSR